MNNARSSYVRFMPLVFLGGLLVMGLHVFRLNNYSSLLNGHKLPPIDLLMAVVKNGFVWAAIGLAFQKMKPALLAFGLFILLSIADFFLVNKNILTEPLVLNRQYTSLFDLNFLPALVFGLVCFKKNGLRYFLPIWLLSYALMMLYVGSAAYQLSPYNNWFGVLKLQRYFSVAFDATWHYDPLPYLYHVVAICCTFIMTGECFTAAAGKKKLKELFQVDLSTQYTKTNALCLFYALRLLINGLVYGLFLFPLNYLWGHTELTGQRLILLCLLTVAALAGIIAATLYYRRFLVEYFINQQKPGWQFWLVNLPIVGMLAFPFVALLPGSKQEEKRNPVFVSDALYTQKRYVLLAAMLVLNGLIMWFNLPEYRMPEIYCIMCVVDLVLMIWYVRSKAGYTVAVFAGVVALHIYWGMLFMANSIDRFTIAVLLFSTFGVIEYTILLPVFHSHTINPVQEPVGQQPLKIEAGI
jgi:hypothetical protein